MTITQISAFWRNDKPDGIGVSFTPDTVDLEALADSIEGYITDMPATMAADPITTPQFLLSQLAEIGKIDRSTRGVEATMVAVLNIAYLERIGIIKPDNFNGMMYLHTP
jgi:hypothetical protein